MADNHDIDITDEEKDRIISDIFLGVITLLHLPKNLYTQTANTLKHGLYDGFGVKFEFGKPDMDLLADLRENIYIFSGAKTATQVHDIQSLMIQGDRVLSFGEFKKLALEKFNVYNGKEGYLESEYITANTSGSSAANWKFTQEHKALFPRLRSVAIIDSSTAPECERMNGVVAAVDDPIWNHNIAPRHFRCRCHEERLDKYDEEKTTPKAKREAVMKANDESMQDVFKMNPGKDRYVFSPKHPYFDIGHKFKSLAKNNWGLPIPDSDAK